MHCDSIGGNAKNQKSKRKCHCVTRPLMSYSTNHIDIGEGMGICNMVSYVNINLSLPKLCPKREAHSKHLVFHVKNQFHYFIKQFHPS